MNHMLGKQNASLGKKLKIDREEVLEKLRELK
jgi:hypothetical protein